MENFIELSLGSFMISHGYDENNTEIEAHCTVQGFAKKLVAVKEKLLSLR